MLKDILWTLPFICFAGGYYITQSTLCMGQFEAPSIEGKSLMQAATELSNHQLSLRVLRIKQSNNLPHGTIIHQIPSPGQMVKPRQTICVTLSKRQGPKFQ